MFDLLIDFLFPRYCVGCGKYGEDLCRECFNDLELSEQICPECGEDSIMGWVHEGCKKTAGMDGLVAIYSYQDPRVKAVIDGIKFDFNKGLIRNMLKNFRFESGITFDYLISVPLHFYRKNWRGFNQAEEIAFVVGKKMNVEVVDSLKRKRITKQQSLILDRKRREKNVRGAFELIKKNRKSLRGKKILLIDDVFTSGADMRECTKILKKAGVETVWGLALAH